MTETERLAAIEAIKQVKARYWRGVDTVDVDLVRSILAEDCELDFRGCMTDPVSGTDFMPTMNITMRGRNSWQFGALDETRAITVHRGHQCEIEITSGSTATGIWVFTDRFFMPPGSPFDRLTGYGHYHETYEKSGDAWYIKTTRITRIKVEAR